MLFPLEGKTVLLGLSGGIACYKTAELARLLVRARANVRCLMTAAAREFITPLTLQSLTGKAVATDIFELAQELEIGHIRLADTANAYVIAPATADVIAKLAHGFADDIVTTVALATRAPLIVAPSMNVNMYDHPAVQRNIEILRSRGVIVVEPGEGELACGWYGKGRLAEPSIVLAEVERAVTPKDFVGEHILVTAGPTREAIDPVRFLSNRSSGKMGYALAEAGWRRGAQVTLITGPTALDPVYGARVIPVVSAEQMFHAVFETLAEATIVFMCAAVADYRPQVVAPGKIKKTAESFALDLIRTPDILSAVSENKGGRFVVGFAAETEDLEAHAREKLLKKNLDLIVANDVLSAQAGFEVDTNSVLLLDRLGNRIEVPRMTKREVANVILDHVRRLRPAQGTESWAR